MLFVPDAEMFQTHSRLAAPGEPLFIVVVTQRPYKLSIHTDSKTGGHCTQTSASPGLSWWMLAYRRDNVISRG